MHNIFIRTFKAGRTKRIVIVEQVSIEHRVVFFSLNSNGFNGIVPSEFLIAKLESLYLPFMSLFHKLHIRLIDCRRRDAVAGDVDEEKFLRPRMSHFCEASQAGALAVGTGEEDGAAFRKVFEDAAEGIPHIALDVLTSTHLISCFFCLGPLVHDIPFFIIACTVDDAAHLKYDVGECGKHPAGLALCAFQIGFLLRGIGLGLRHGIPVMYFVEIADFLTHPAMETFRLIDFRIEETFFVPFHRDALGRAYGHTGTAAAAVFFFMLYVHINVS